MSALQPKQSPETVEKNILCKVRIEKKIQFLRVVYHKINQSEVAC